MLFSARHNELRCCSATEEVSLLCRLTEAGAVWKRWVRFSGTHISTRSTWAPDSLLSPSCLACNHCCPSVDGSVTNRHS